jgi:hypothetical protein
MFVNSTLRHSLLAQVAYATGIDRSSSTCTCRRADVGQTGYTGAAISGVPEIAICGNNTVLNAFLDLSLSVSQSSAICGVPSARPTVFSTTAMVTFGVLPNYVEKKENYCNPRGDRVVDRIYMRDEF